MAGDKIRVQGSTGSIIAGIGIARVGDRIVKDLGGGITVGGPGDGGTGRGQARYIHFGHS